MDKARMRLSGKKLLVTGAGGFIGSHLVAELVRSGADVRAMVHYRSDGSAGWLDSIAESKDVEIVAGDICDRDFLSHAIANREVVFHLAALIGIPYSYTAPFSYLRVNVEGTLNLLRLSREHSVSRVVHTSTSEVYGTPEELPLNESSCIKAQSPYAASKTSADQFANSYWSAFNLPVVTVRPFNTYGPRQSARAIIPAIITQCLTGSSQIELGNLEPTRDLNYVSDIVNGFIAAASVEGVEGKTFVLGSGAEISIGDLARKLAAICESEAKIVTSAERKRPTQSEVLRLVADSSLAREELGWKPAVELEQGLRLTVDWIRENIDCYRTDEYVI